MACHFIRTYLRTYIRTYLRDISKKKNAILILYHKDANLGNMRCHEQLITDLLFKLCYQGYL